ncbi:unnamed protein product [Tuber melanosporum]|uniref:(Perigord truffle) hypothetical protein n=1 Tax=Tuber melanosporum (strain Mel28) TaxID=656061 RepID=D5G4X5_TUBMM|nr:uncharacterized protein GSTUM_00000138001 [Tuber melanosporum]CAZ79567.1 unnamed protein product [Tuber melanosporum]
MVLPVGWDSMDEIDLDYIAWSLPRSEQGECRGRTTKVKIAPEELFTPGAIFVKPIGSLEGLWGKKRCANFRSTISTRCVRDIKREYSWKIYNVCCNPETGADAHYVRIKFSDEAKDVYFASYVTALNGVAAKRFLQGPKEERARPFGIGFDRGVASKERLYLISNCSKQTPYLRRVSVKLEVNTDGSWRRSDGDVDRIGFATYKSAPKSAIWASSSPETIPFKDDPFLRFARVTLRFGRQKERTILDMGKSFSPVFSSRKQCASITLSSVRVRICDDNQSTEPIQTKVRLVFTDKGKNRSSFLRSQAKSAAVVEAEKALLLFKKSVELSGDNTLALEDNLEDDAIFEMNIADVVSKNFSVRLKGDITSEKKNINGVFKGSKLLLVPCFPSNGVHLVLQSVDGEYVLRQYIPSPIQFISSITASSFTGPSVSMLRRMGENIEREGNGRITYLFENGETDAASIVEKVVSIMEKLHTYQTSPPTTARSAQSSPRFPQGRGHRLLTPPQSPPRMLSSFRRPQSRVFEWAGPPSVHASVEDLSTIDEASSSGEYLMAPAPAPPSVPSYRSTRSGDTYASSQHQHPRASTPCSAAYTESIYSARSATLKRALRNMEESGARTSLPVMGRMF